MQHPFRKSNRNLFILILLALAIPLFSLQPDWVEQYYARCIYPNLSLTFRGLLGRLPFSVGDLLYAAAVMFLLWKIIRFFRQLYSLGLRQFPWGSFLRKFLTITLLFYIIFSLLWGLNYFRQGIAGQFKLKPDPYGEKELKVLVPLLQQRLNTYALQVDSLNRQKLSQQKELTAAAKAAFQKTTSFYPFLTYNIASVKPSIYTPLAPYFGFTGYFNPFTSEAQLNIEVPVFMRPFIINHEIGHQLGYAKENEASFISFLVCRHSGNPNFLYAVYFELYRTAGNELRRMDEGFMKNMDDGLSPRVQADMRELGIYLKKFQNVLEPLVSSFYDKFLKINNQPKGMATYNQVIALVWAYVQKNGSESL